MLDSLQGNLVIVEACLRSCHSDIEIQIVQEPEGENIDSRDYEKWRNLPLNPINTLYDRQQLPIIWALTVDRTCRVHSNHPVATSHLNAIPSLVKIPYIVGLYIILFHNISKSRKVLRKKI